MDFLEQIRTITMPTHQAVENLPCMHSLVSGHCTHQVYIEILLSFYQCHAHLKHHIDEYQLEHPLLDSISFKLDALEKDLRFFDSFSVSEISGTSKHPFWSKPLDVWGLMYVLEGSNKGSSMIANLLHHQYQFSRNCGATYFNLYRNELAQRWREFLKQLSIRLQENLNLNQVIHSAISVFELFKVHLSDIRVIYEK